VSNSDGVLIQGNTCSNSTDQHGIYCSGSRNCIIRGNTCFGNNYDGIHVNVLTGQLGDGGSGGVTNHLIENNVCHDNTLAGMDIEGVSGCTFRNNLCYGNGKHGFTIHSQDQANTPQTKNCAFINNTVLNSNTNITACIQFQSVDTAGMVVFNNALINTGNGGTMWTFAALMAGFQSDYDAVSDVFSQNGGTTKITLAQWRTATGKDAHSVVFTAANLFVNAPTDFHLKASVTGVPGIASLGGYTAPTTDITGATRTTMRAGCYA
jgi:parallel beta-helix repeat protein